MTGRSRPFDIRLSVKDADTAIAALRAFGAEGERALARLERASRGPTAGMRALSAAQGEASVAISGLAGRAGALAPILGAFGPAGTAAAAAIGAVTAATVGGLAAWAPYEQQLNRLNGVLKATGSAAGLTGGQIRDMAESLAKSTMATAEGALEAATALATFKTVSGDTFKQALALSQDLASVFGGDLRGATVRLAKALEEPVRGLDSLRESGVSFTLAQKDQIKALVESGQMLKAQGIILDTVRQQVGGAGAAERGGLTGSVKGLSDAWSGLLKEIGSSPAILAGANLLLAALAGNLELLRSFAPKSEEQSIQAKLGELDTKLALAKAALADAGLKARQAAEVPAGALPNPFASAAKPSDETLQRLRDEVEGIEDVIAVQRERLQVIRDLRGAMEEEAAAQGRRAQAEQARQLANDNLKALSERIDPAVAALKAYREGLNIVNEAERQGVGTTEDLARAKQILAKAYNDARDPLNKQVKALQDEAAALRETGAARERLKALQAAENASPIGEVSPAERLRLESAVNDLLAARARDKTRELQDALELEQAEFRLVDALPEVRERELALLKTKNDLAKEGVEIGSDEYEQRLRIAGAIADTKAATDLARQAANENARVWTRAGEGIQDALRQAFNYDAAGRQTVDFATRFKSLMFSTIADVQAAMVFKPFVGGALQSVGAPNEVLRQFGVRPGQASSLPALLSAAGGFGSAGGLPGGISAAIALYRLINGASLTAGSAAIGNGFAGLGNLIGGADLGARFGNAGLAFSSPMASIGSFGVNFLLDRLLGDRGIGSQVGSIVGSLAGSFLGPVGSIVGSALGNLLGGLFGGKASVGPNANGIVNFTGGRASVGGLGADNGGDVGIARELADAASKGVNAVLDRLGATMPGLPGAGTPDTSIGYLRGRYFSKVGGANAEFDDAQAAIADFIRRALSSGTAQGINDEVRAALSRAADDPEQLGTRIEFAQTFRNSVRTAAGSTSSRQAQLTGFQIAGEENGRQVLADLRKFVELAKESFGAGDSRVGEARTAMRNRVLGLLGPLDEGADKPLDGAAAGLAELRARLQGLRDALVETGDSAEEAQRKIDAAYERDKAKVAKQLNGGVASGLRGLAGLGSVDGAIALKDQMAQETRDSVAAGGDLAALARYQGQRVSMVLSGWTESEIEAWRAYLQSVGELTDDARGRLDAAAARARAREATAKALTGQMVVWAGEASVAQSAFDRASQAYQSALSDQASTLEQTRDSLARFKDSFGALRRELLLNPTYSSLTATGIYGEAASQYGDLAGRARLGDLKAMEQLEGIAKSFLDSSLAVNAKGPAYQADLQRVLQDLADTESVAERNARNIDDQVKLARDALKEAQGIGTNTKTIAELMADFKTAQGNLATNRTTTAAGQRDAFDRLADDFGRDYRAAQSETERRGVYERYAPIRDAIFQAITDLESAQMIGEKYYRGDMSDSGALRLRERVYQLGGIPRFEFGGSFTVGGDGRTDSTLVPFRATRGEQVTVRTPSQVVAEGRRDQAIIDGLAEMNAYLRRLGDRLAALEAERATGTYARSGRW